MTSSLRRKTLTGTVWSFAERYSVQCLHFIGMMIMARLLTPSDYGLVGMVTVFISLSQCLLDGGFSQAIIRMQDRDDGDTSTAFWFNAGMATALYGLIWLLAPAIAEFYSEPRLVAVVRVLCVSIIINSTALVQRALITVRLDFRLQARASVSAAGVAGVAGVTAALHGMGVWSLVIYQLTLAMVATTLIWIMAGWRPKRGFCGRAFRRMAAFGGRLTMAGIISTVYDNIYPLVIGRFFSPAILGYYSRAEHFGGFLSVNTSHVLQRVTYPLMCSMQDDDAGLRDIFLRYIRIVSFVIFPLIICIVVLSPQVVTVALGEKWLPAAPMMSILGLGLMLFPIHTLNLTLLQVKGRTDLYLRLEIVKKVIGVVMICGSLYFGIMGVCAGAALNAMIGLLAGSHYTRRMIGVGQWRQLREMLPSIGCSALGAVAAYGALNISENALIQLVAGVISLLTVYLLACGVCGVAGINEIRRICRR